MYILWTQVIKSLFLVFGQKKPYKGPIVGVETDRMRMDSSPTKQRNFEEGAELKS
jgi:hypothetical protein